MFVGNFEKVSLKQYTEDLKKLLNIEDNSYESIVIPFRATVGSAGYDFVSPIDICIKPNQLVKVPTGIRVKIENGYYLSIYPRSSLGFKYQLGLANTVGIIDSDYYYADNEGHIIVALVNRGDKEVIIKKGDRFVQGIFNAYFLANEKEVKDIRTGGFGSSNK